MQNNNIKEPTQKINLEKQRTKTKVIIINFYLKRCVSSDHV